MIDWLKLFWRLKGERDLYRNQYIASLETQHELNESLEARSKDAARWQRRAVELQEKLEWLTCSDGQDLRLGEVVESLERRGFLDRDNRHDLAPCIDEVSVQLYAVVEEAGEVARMLRRIAQGREVLDPERMARECADVMIAAVCLIVKAAGVSAWRVGREKMIADEARGWLHNGTPNS